MCGKDGAQRGVYKLKEEHEEGGSEQKKKREKDINRKEESKSREKKRIALITKENVRCTNFRPLTCLRVNLFKGDHS